MVVIKLKLIIDYDKFFISYQSDLGNICREQSVLHPAVVKPNAVTNLPRTHSFKYQHLKQYIYFP